MLSKKQRMGETLMRLNGIGYLGGRFEFEDDDQYPLMRQISVE